MYLKDVDFWGQFRDNYRMKTKVHAVSKKPLEIKNGNITVKIYAGKNRVNGSSYPQFTLVHYFGNQRVKRRFADLNNNDSLGE